MARQGSRVAQRRGTSTPASQLQAHRRLLADTLKSCQPLHLRYQSRHTFRAVCGLEHTEEQPRPRSAFSRFLRATLPARRPSEGAWAAPSMLALGARSPSPSLKHTRATPAPSPWVRVLVKPSKKLSNNASLIKVCPRKPCCKARPPLGRQVQGHPSDFRD